MAGLAFNSKSVISVKHKDPSSKYSVAEMQKLRAQRISSAMLSMLKLLKSKASVFQSWFELKHYLSRNT